MSYDPHACLQEVVRLAQKAGKEILQIYEQNQPLQIILKEDQSPVTIADLTAQEIIAAGLQNIAPHIPQLSEEGAKVSYKNRREWDYYWLIDPLDGTREFIQRSGEFTVNIALIHNGNPVLGVIYAPLAKLTYYACVGRGAFKLSKDNKLAEPISIRSWELGLFRVIASRRHRLFLQEFLMPYGRTEITYRGSSLKFCLLAEGKADIYLRFSAIQEWDTAAGQCIVEQAGGLVLNSDWEPLRYNTKSKLVIPAFIVLGDAEKLLPILKSNMLFKETK